jgi:alanine racemase
MQLTSQIIAIQTLAVGESVGYGARFTATKVTRIGVVACGYADGYPRHAPNGTPIAVNGKLTRTLGRVSMDMLFCDVTDMPEADIGSGVELWGATVPVDVVAEASGTVGYELLCAVAPRVPMMVVA